MSVPRREARARRAYKARIVHVHERASTRRPDVRVNVRCTHVKCVQEGSKRS